MSSFPVSYLDNNINTIFLLRNVSFSPLSQLTLIKQRSLFGEAWNEQTPSGSRSHIYFQRRNELQHAIGFYISFMGLIFLRYRKHNDCVFDKTIRRTRWLDKCLNRWGFPHDYMPHIFLFFMSWLSDGNSNHCLTLLTDNLLSYALVDITYCDATVPYLMSAWDWNSTKNY